MCLKTACLTGVHVHGASHSYVNSARAQEGSVQYTPCWLTCKAQTDRCGRAPLLLATPWLYQCLADRLTGGGSVPSGAPLRLSAACCAEEGRADAQHVRQPRQRALARGAAPLRRQHTGKRSATRHTCMHAWAACHSCCRHRHSTGPDPLQYIGRCAASLPQRHRGGRPAAGCRAPAAYAFSEAPAQTNY